MTDTPARVFRHSLGERIASAIATGLFVLLFGAFMAGAIALLMQGDAGVGLFFLLMALGAACLGAYVWRDGTAKSGWRVEIAPPWLRLNLPATRSYWSRPQAFAGEVPLSALAAVEWRTEH